MRPGHIRVFDGLRITTEHMNHLQGSLHSALQDIRAILGLGRVYYGFEVVAEGGQAITVQPGLAFDQQGNRLVCDEPRTLPVSFAPGEDATFVCIKYDQIEDGQVEGQFTMVWDSCSVVLRTTMPEVKDNLIAIARLIKSDGGTFAIVGPTGQGQGEEATDAPAEAAEPHAGEITGAPESGAEISAAAGGTGEAATPGETATAATEAPSVEKGGEAGVAPGPEAPVSVPRPWRLRVQQDVMRLAADAGAENRLSAVLLEPLKRKLGGRDTADGGELLFTLAEKEVALDFPALSLNCHTLMSVAVSVAEKPGAEETQPQYAGLKCQSASRGEVTFAGDQVSQFGISTVHPYANAGPGGVSWSASELTERGIARLPLAALWKGIESDGTRAVLQPLQLLMRIDKPSGSGFRVVCHLLWTGAISEAILRELETQNLGFTWESVLAWKAAGESSE